MNVVTRQVYYFEDLELGMEASFAKTVTAADILAFAEVTGDWNPVHLDTEYAAKTVFRRIGWVKPESRRCVLRAAKDSPDTS